tara:strand:+ start:228 stop:683 length:456 start_codon:yes stop_codon:yes gene_type:complete
MDLILWRHAQANVGEPDIKRELDQYGMKQAAQMGEWLDRNLPRSCKILSGVSLRTIQTTEALGRKYKIIPEINPLTHPEDMLSIIKWPVEKSSVLVVGHQPWLGELAALILTGKKRDWDIKKSNAWWISMNQNDHSRKLYLKAVLAPEFFG